MGDLTNPLNKPATQERVDLWMRWAAAVLSLLLMLCPLGNPPVERTQEARVLEVAREMLGAPWQEWLIPHLNGEIRVQKPPLAYWLSAAAFKIGGVSEGVARVPFALVGWLMLIVVYWTAAWLFGPRAGLLAGGMLCATMMFAEHARLAETDILATFFVTGAIASIWRGWPVANERPPHDRAWFATSGFMIGMAVFAKGLPALFTLVFLFAMTAVMRDWRVLWRWCRSGAPLFALAVGSPWFGYIFMKVGIKTFADETRIGLVGEEHTGTVLNYVPDLLRALAPWSAITIMGVIIACFMWRRDWRLRGLMLWAGAVLVPLCIGGQRQYHYVLPALPPLAILTGWVLDESLTRRLAQWKLADGLTIAMFAVMLLGAAAIPIIGIRARPGRAHEDIAAAVTLGCASLLGIWACIRSHQRNVIIAVGLTSLATTIFTQLWLPSLQPDNTRAVAARVHELAHGPFCFYGDNVSIPLIFYLQRKIPRYPTEPDLIAAVATEPALVVLAQTKAGHPPPRLPARLERIGRVESEKQMIEVYQRQE